MVRKGRLRERIGDGEAGQLVLHRLASDEVDQVVGGGVVADRDHEGGQVADEHRCAGGLVLDHARRQRGQGRVDGDLLPPAPPGRCTASATAPST